MNLFQKISCCLLFFLASCAAFAQVKPNLFTEELNPTDANFEVYSQKNGINRRAKVSNLAKTIGPLIEATAVGFTPTASGNTTHLRKFVLDPFGNWYFIDHLGNAILIRRGDAVGGDLTGNLPTPTVDGLQGRPVSSAAPSSGNVLAWNGTSWGPAPSVNSKTFESFAGMTGSAITPTATLPASDREWKMHLFRTGVRMQYLKDFTISGGNINLVLAAQNEDFTLIIEN